MYMMIVSKISEPIENVNMSSIMYLLLKYDVIG